MRVADTLKGVATQTKPAFAGFKSFSPPSRASLRGLRLYSRTMQGCWRKFTKLTCSRYGVCRSAPQILTKYLGSFGSQTTNYLTHILHQSQQK